MAHADTYKIWMVLTNLLLGVALLYLFFPDRKWGRSLFYRKKFDALNITQRIILNRYYGKSLLLTAFLFQAIVLGFSIYDPLKEYLVFRVILVLFGSITLRILWSREINRLASQDKA